MTFTPREYYDWIQGQIYAKREWLKTHGGKVQWSEQDIDAKKYDLAILEAMSAAYERKFAADAIDESAVR
jgi:hypothetical protein